MVVYVPSTLLIVQRHRGHAYAVISDKWFRYEDSKLVPVPSFPGSAKERFRDGRDPGPRRRGGRGDHYRHPWDAAPNRTGFRRRA